LLSGFLPLEEVGRMNVDKDREAFDGTSTSISMDKLVSRFKVLGLSYKGKEGRGSTEKISRRTKVE